MACEAKPTSAATVEELPVSLALAREEAALAKHSHNAD